jgi:hypothetical protein
LHFHVVVCNSFKLITGNSVYDNDNLNKSIVDFLRLSKFLSLADIGDFTEAFGALKEVAENTTDFFFCSESPMFSVAFLDCPKQCSLFCYLN